MDEYLCAFDIGTTGVKAGIFTPDGIALGTAYREYKVIFPRPQWVEQCVDEIWEAQCETSQEIIHKTKIDPKNVVAVGISCQRATFVPIDKDENPLTNFIGWQDKRSVKQCEKMKQLIGEEKYYQITGLSIEPTASVSKIVWLKENLPEIFKKTYKFASTQNVHLRQLGVKNAPCDLPDASYMGLLDVNRLKWSQELLELLDIPVEKLPDLVPSGTLVGSLSEEAAQCTGLMKGTPLVTAGGDNQCSALGAGVARPGLVSVGIGTGAAVLIGLEKPLNHPDKALACLAHTVPGMWEMEGICFASGAAYKWFRDRIGYLEKEVAAKLGVDAYDILNIEASQIPQGSSGLIIIPTFLGAGAPYWYSKAQAVFLGLTLDTDKQTLTRAIMEGICLEIRCMLEAIQKVKKEITEIRIWGGASKSRLWNQIAADVYGISVVKTKVGDTGLIGAAICAGAGVELFKNMQDGANSMVHISEVYEPDLEAHKIYDIEFSIYKDTFTALMNTHIFEKIADLKQLL